MINFIPPWPGLEPRPLQVWPGGPVLNQLNHSKIKKHLNKYQTAHWAHHGPHLTGVVAALPSGAEGRRGQDEDLLRHGVDLPHALVVGHHGDLRLTHAQGDRAGCATRKESVFYLFYCMDVDGTIIFVAGPDSVFVSFEFLKWSNDVDFFLHG